MVFPKKILTTRVHRTLTAGMESVAAFGRCGERLTAEALPHPARNEAWLKVLHDALGHQIFVIEAEDDNGIVGLLPLAEVSSLLFGRFLVGLPYLNSGGVWTNDGQVATALIDAAIDLADERNVKHLELRHQRCWHHEALTKSRSSKVIMQMELPETADQLWKQFKSKLRSQIRSGLKHEFVVRWGGRELLGPFYAMFSQRMRDLGTPVFSKKLFGCMIDQFNDAVEICCLYVGDTPAAAAIVVHGTMVTEVPSASCLTSFNSLNANMVLYWNLLTRAIEQGSRVFDFGRSTSGGGTWRFKKQWGAVSSPSFWQYYVRKGQHDLLRPDNGKFSLAIEAWRRLPVSVTRLIGPAIVRGIP